MSRFTYSVGRWRGIFLPKSGKTGLLAVVLSFFSVFALGFLAAPSWYSFLPGYEEFAVGVTTWTRYNKQADMDIVKLALFGLVIGYFIFCLFLHFMNQYVTEEPKIQISLVAGYLFFLFSIFAQKKITSNLGLVVLVATAIYIILYFRREGTSDEYINVLLVTLFMQFNVIAIATAVKVILGAGAASLAPVITILQVVALALGIIYAINMRNRQEILARYRILAAAQVMLPVCMAGFYSFYYYYEGTDEYIQLFYSGRWKWFCLLVVAGCLAYNLYAFGKKKKGILITTLISIATYQAFEIPDGMLSPDYFHNGEITMPAQQLLSYGKIPYVDIVPIHGLCDYYYGLISRLVFDGSYLSLNAAYVVGRVLMAALFAVLLYFLWEDHKNAVLLIIPFCTFLAITAGMRYLVMFFTFFILFSQKVRVHVLKYIWWWVFLSIVGIAWNAPIGGATAVAFLPVILWRVFRELPNELKDLWYDTEKKTKGKAAIGYGILLLTGLAFIPLFFKIVIYLKENTETTLIVNGTQMIENVKNVTDYLVPGAITETGGFFLQTFGFLLPLAVCLYYGFSRAREEIRAEAFHHVVVMVAFFYIISNYAFVRFDNGLRSGILAVFFLILIGVGMLLPSLQKGKHSNLDFTIFVVFFLLAIYLSDQNFLDGEKDIVGDYVVESSTKTEIAGKKINDPIVYVTGDSLGIPNMGCGFARTTTLNSLKNINHVLEATVGEKGEYLDLTNSISNYVIFDHETVSSYTSAYNISNDQMQKNAIAELKKNEPELILIAPFIMFDEAPLSIRSNDLYEYILNQGYRPYQYQDVIYMQKCDNEVADGTDGSESFAELMHKSDFGALPAAWGTVDANLEEVSAKRTEEPVITEEGEYGVRIHFDEPVAAADVKYVRIDLVGNYGGIGSEVKEQDMKILFPGSQDGNQKHFTFGLFSDVTEYLVPVGTSPYWQAQSELTDITVLYSQDMKGMELEVTFYR